MLTVKHYACDLCNTYILGTTYFHTKSAAATPAENPMPTPNKNNMCASLGNPAWNGPALRPFCFVVQTDTIGDKPHKSARSLCLGARFVKTGIGSWSRTNTGQLQRMAAIPIRRSLYNRIALTSTKSQRAIRSNGPVAYLPANYSGTSVGAQFWSRLRESNPQLCLLGREVPYQLGEACVSCYSCSFVEGLSIYAQDLFF